AANSIDGFRPDGRTSVFQVVTVNRGDDTVFYLHEFYRISNTLRLIHIHRQRPSCSYSTERTRTGTDIPQNHKSGSTRSPAFAHIRTVSAFADGMKFMGVY